MAQVKIPMDCAAGCSGPGARLKITMDGTLRFHGMVMDWELDGGEDTGYITMNALDPMELWTHRPARDGPDSSDPGDFSNPGMFTGVDYSPTGANVLDNMLRQSEDGTDQAAGEGPLFLTLGTFETGGTPLYAGPQDWPMTIAEVVNLMVSSGELDVVITPTDPGGGIMGTVDSYNGDFGTDLSGSVVFEYGTGAKNVRAVRWNQDMSNITNKLWYYGGPKIHTIADPDAVQHWCWNITGDDCCFTGVDGPHCTCTSPSAAAMQTAYAAVAACRGTGEGSPGDSRGDFGVRMDIQIFDAAGENCVGRGGLDPGRDLYRWLWLAESWARCEPRTLIHVTPTRGTAISSFDIGDLVGITLGSGVCGGISGAQRVYQYTISWGPDGPFELSELQTSSDLGVGN
jgi:hypothetical protein